MSLASTRKLIDEFDKQWDRGLAPDVAEFVAAHRSLSPSQLSQVLLMDQSRRWSRGERVTAEDYFNRFPDLLENTEASVDLLFAEFLLEEESGSKISAEDFVSRFPQFATEFQRQIEFHRIIGAELLFGTSGVELDDLESPEAPSAIEVPGYEILRELGRGGLGIVYLARDKQLNRNVALKMLLAGRFASSTLLKRLLLEAEATARLQHPNIVQIYKVGQHEGHPFLALEYIAGGTLSQWMERRPQSPRDAANIIREVAIAVQFAHENGVIHRDLKPSNLLLQSLQVHASATGVEVSELTGGSSSTSLLCPNFRIKIADFGLAKFIERDEPNSRGPTTMTGDLIGTAAYMSPEQALGASGKRGEDHLTASTDIYSLGAILYELLTGRPPFVGVQPLEVLSQVVSDEPIRPSQLVRHIPRDLQTICLKCLEKSPSRRYASAAALAEDLHRFLSNQPIVGRNTMMLERGWRWCRRNPVKTSLAACIACLLLMVASVSSVYSMMLGNQLMLTTQSELAEKSLKMRALEQLWESSISRAEALRTSRKVGQRFDSLKAIETAQEIGKSIPFESHQNDRMRNATVAALALPDMISERPWKRPWTDSVAIQSFDDSQRVFVHLTEPDCAVVRHVGDGKELVRIEDVEPDSKLLLCSDGTKLAIFNRWCRVFDLKESTGKLLFESTSSGPWAFSADGSHIVGTDDEGLLKCVELGGNQATKTVGRFPGQQQVAVSPDLQRIALWVDNWIQVVDVGTGQITFQAPKQSQIPWQTFAWHPSSRYLAIDGDYEERVTLWDVVNGERLKKFDIASSGPLSFSFDAGGNRLVTYNAWNRKLQLWGVSSGEEEFSLKGDTLIGMSPNVEGGFSILKSVDSENIARVKFVCSSVYETLLSIRKDTAQHATVDVSYSYDGRYLAFANRGVIDVFHTPTMACVAQAVAPRCFVQFDAEGSLLTLSELGVSDSGSIERGLFRWRRRSSSELPFSCSFGPPEAIHRPLTDFASAPFGVGASGELIAACMDDGVLIWSNKLSKAVRSQASHFDVRRVSISPDEKRVASAGWNGGKVCIWNAETGELVHTIDEPSACTVRFSPDGKMLATLSNQVTVWATDSWKVLYTVKVDGQPASGVSASFSPDSRTLAVSDSSGNVHLINASSGHEYLLLAGPVGRQVCSLHYRPDGKQLVVLPGGEPAHLWNLDAIQAELDARNLGWEKDNQETPLANLGSDWNLSSSRMVAREQPSQVSFVFDERFNQLQAAQWIIEATWASSKSDFVAAKSAIKRAIALNPKDPEACNNLAWLLSTGPSQLRDPDKAIELAEMAVQRGRDSQKGLFANTLGVAQYRTQQFAEARRTLTQSLSTQAPENQPFDLYFLSMCSSQLGEDAEAREYFDRAEALRLKFKSVVAFQEQKELAEFSTEARSLLKLDKQSVFT